MSATSKLALVSPRFAASLRASVMAVADRVEADRGEAQFGKVQGRRGLAAARVEHVAVDLARLDQRLDLRLRLADAPRRAEALELLGLAAVCRIEHRLFWLCRHTPCLSTRLIYVNMIDMGDILDDQPLGYLLYRVAQRAAYRGDRDRARTAWI